MATAGKGGTGGVGGDGGGGGAGGGGGLLYGNGGAAAYPPGQAGEPGFRPVVVPVGAGRVSDSERQGHSPRLTRRAKRASRAFGRWWCRWEPGA